MNYFVMGLMPSVDKFYMDSFKVLVAVLVIFPILGNISFTILEYRLGQRGLIASAMENFKWIPFLYVILFVAHSPVLNYSLACSSSVASVSTSPLPYSPICSQ
jgi:hypothetical protein